MSGHLSTSYFRIKGIKISRNKRSRIFFQNFSQIFREFFEVFARFSKFSDVFGPVRTCSDAFGCIRIHPGAFGKFRKYWSEKCDFCISGRDFDRLDLFLTSASATGGSGAIPGGLCGVYVGGGPD